MPILPPIVSFGQGLVPNIDPIEEIIEYVMHTPENINANILREMLLNAHSTQIPAHEPIEEPGSHVT